MLNLQYWIPTILINAAETLRHVLRGVERTAFLIKLYS